MLSVFCNSTINGILSVQILTCFVSQYKFTKSNNMKCRPSLHMIMWLTILCQHIVNKYLFTLRYQILLQRKCFTGCILGSLSSWTIWNLPFQKRQTSFQWSILMSSSPAYFLVGEKWSAYFLTFFQVSFTIHIHRVESREVLLAPQQATDPGGIVTMVTTSGRSFTRQIKTEDGAVQETNPAIPGELVLGN